MQEIVTKINEKLKNSGWYDELRIFLESSDFSDIITELKKKVEVDNQRFCPSLGKAFRFMEEVSCSKVKTVLLIDYAPNRLEYSDGIVLNSPNKIIDPIQLNIVKSSGRTTRIIDHWTEQGILMLPLSLTSRIEGKAHKKLWEPFIMRMLETINKKHPNIPWVLLGSDTWKYEEDIDSSYIKKIELKFPIQDNNWGAWINSILSSYNKAIIEW
jgi:uracil DNA glycosylase